MLLNEISNVLVQYWAICVVLFVLGWLLKNKFNHGLNKYPGPFLAGYTNWWRFLDVSRRQHHHTQIDLHRKHGDIVRLGPNILSFADPAAIKDIYGHQSGLTKTGFYPVWSPLVKGSRVWSMFTITDIDYHSRFRRCVNNAFSMSTMVSYEPLVDSTTVAFMEQTKKLYIETGKSCDFARWLQFYAFDNIGEITWSKRLGFVDENKDVDGMVGNLEKFIRYASLYGQMPWLDITIGKKNPLTRMLSRWGFAQKSTPVVLFAAKQAAERRAHLSNTDKSADKDHHGTDLLSRFIASQQDHPEFMTDTQVLTASVSLPAAGSDTTASSLSSVFYHVLRNPSILAKLLSELSTAVADGTVTPHGEHSLISWSDAQKLPYLDACIQEAFRIFPAIGLLMERYVPAQGASICGRHVPGGTIVGCSAWVVQRRKEVFGEDVDTYRPERWLEADKERVKLMKGSMLQFGGGVHTCIGKNISLLEMYKLVPTFLWNFEIQFVEPEKEWKVDNSWFVRQSEFNVKFKPRLNK